MQYEDDEINVMKRIRNAGVLLICFCVSISLSACDSGTQGDNKLLARVVTVNAKALTPTYGIRIPMLARLPSGLTTLLFV